MQNKTFSLRLKFDAIIVVLYEYAHNANFEKKLMSDIKYF